MKETNLVLRNITIIGVACFALGCSQPPSPVAKTEKMVLSVGAKLSYEDSCRLLQKLDVLPKGDIPRLPASMPAFDDHIHGVSFFRTRVEKESLDNLTIPKTYFARSEIRGTSFKNTDLSESRLCWNDFIEVDFTGAKLSGSDLRASVYENVKFAKADLQKADLRHATFTNCDFTGAIMRGAKLSKDAKVLDSLSLSQRDEIDYQPEGKEPPGG